MNGEIYIIYTDILFLINFTLDFICLFLAAKFASLPLKLIRPLLGAAAGGAYSILAFAIDEWHFLLKIPVHIAAAVVICIIAFGFKGIIKSTLVFILTSALLGGALTAVYGIAGKYSEFNGGFYTELSPVLLVIFALLSVAVIFVYITLVKKKIYTASVEADLIFGTAAVSLKLLVDSGCFVRDPVSGDSVVIVSARALSPFIECREIDEDSLKGLGRTARLIPVTTAAGSGLMPAFRPDRLYIKNRNDERKVSATVAIDNQTDNFNGYDGLISAEII